MSSAVGRAHFCWLQKYFIVIMNEKQAKILALSFFKFILTSLFGML